MTPTFVVDCSVVMAWCFKDERTEATDELQTRLVAEAAVVPSVLFFEIANVLTMAEQRKRITADESQLFIQLISTFDIQVDPMEARRWLDRLPYLCRTRKLSSYDAAYLDLALRRGLPLATLDDDLRSAAKKAGVALLGK